MSLTVSLPDLSDPEVKKLVYDAQGTASAHPRRESPQVMTRLRNMSLSAKLLSLVATFLVVFLVYTQFENHVLNPLIMSRTVKVNPLLVLVSILVAASIGSWIGGTLGGFVAALLAIPVASSIQVIVREVWTATAPVDHPDLER